MMKIAFLASHNGSAARAIAEACAKGTLSAQPALLISNNGGAKALEWAQNMGLQTSVINAGNTSDTDAAIFKALANCGATLVVCSGYMKLIGPKTIAAAKGAVLNVHPALLPRHGGKGMYGRHVHQAVFDAKEKETGITIHLVDGEYDHGRVIAQKTLPVKNTDSVEDIEEMVKAAEPDFYIETIGRIISGNLSLS